MPNHNDHLIPVNFSTADQCSDDHEHATHYLVAVDYFHEHYVERPRHHHVHDDFGPGFHDHDGAAPIHEHYDNLDVDYHHPDDHLNDGRGPGA